MPPKQRGGKRLALTGMALIAVVAVAVTATVLVMRHSNNDGGGGGATPSATPAASSDIASANDTGPVAIITDDPTCPDHGVTVNSTVAKLDDWGKRDASIPASEWTPQMRTMYENAATVLREEADALVAYAKKTPHRVMRELYEQTIAYQRAYADAIPNYTPADDHLALVANATDAAATFVCTAVQKLSAARRSVQVPAAQPPTTVAPATDPASPTRFLTAANPVCADWMTLTDSYADEVHQLYAAIDNTTSATDWVPQIRVSWERLAEIYGSHYAPGVEELGRKSGNPIWEDFAVLSAQYLRAFAAAVPTYTVNDWYFTNAAVNAYGAVGEACQSLG